MTNQAKGFHFETMPSIQFETDIPTFDARRFYWDRETQALVGEASTIGFRNMPHTIRIRGRSRTEEFRRADTVIRDGDIQHWLYLPVSGFCPIAAVAIQND